VIVRHHPEGGSFVSAGPVPLLGDLSGLTPRSRDVGWQESAEYTRMRVSSRESDGKVGRYDCMRKNPGSAGSARMGRKG
jgi:hypothetical protein